MVPPDKLQRAVIVGATSLRGKDLSDLLEERFPTAKLTLLDEDVAAGTLTDAGGEPAVIQSVDPESFQDAQFVFFAGKPDFASKHAAIAIQDAEFVVDLSGGLRNSPEFCTWIPSLDLVLPPPESKTRKAKGYYSPSAPVMVSCALAAGLREFDPLSISLVFLQPVSEYGIEGIQELEKQTIGLLSFQPIPQQVFKTQVAFNLMGGLGEANREIIGNIHEGVSRDVATYLSRRAPIPALQLIQAPVFHSLAFSAYAEFNANIDLAQLEERLTTAGFQFPEGEAPPPSAVDAAGAERPLLAHVVRDQNRPSGFWFWGSADNLRLTALNAVAIAERLLNP